MKCNICKNEIFVDMNTRKKIQCAKCGSLERTRLLWLYIQKIKINESTKVLHIAPEKGLYDVLSKQLNASNYITADINPSGYKFAENCIKLDLCMLDDQPAAEYDLIIHSHVLEHTPCNIAYTLFHLHRMLKDDGIHLCIIPFMGGKYDECFQDISHEERKKRFGQHDHIRRFGAEDIPSHLGALVTLPKAFDATRDFSVKDLKNANIPENQWKGFHPSTVLLLRKYDMKLISRDRM